MTTRYCYKYHPRSPRLEGHDFTLSLWYCEDLDYADYETEYDERYCMGTSVDVGGCHATFVSWRTKNRVYEEASKFGLAVEGRERHPYPSRVSDDAPRYRSGTKLTLCRDDECKMQLTEEQVDNICDKACNKHQRLYNVEYCEVKEYKLTQEMRDAFGPKETDFDKKWKYKKFGTFRVKRESQQ
ncbi:hypothetical protein A9K97_gp372 [Tokyovirus A1]|uniref:hypothetical protein n=1 Tax=Tokyovirus A1 TaxID=1826170 RepID=UPI0007A96939|nr:hypothetical protein A9K97_gp372 [Tokyovirus A1]BAU79979.1 hypothetical protein [Tokyovirus A1]